MLQEDNYYCRPAKEDEDLMAESADATLNDPGLPELMTDANLLESLTDSPSIEWHPTYLSWFTEKTQEGDVTSQEPDLIQHASSNSPLSNFLMDTTTSADSHQEYAHEEEISIAAGDTADVRTSGNKGPTETSTSVPKRKWDFVMLTPPTLQIPEDALASGTEQRPGDRKKHDKSWLLVALLVPLCVFIVVMLALGIVYCTSCAVEPRNKSITDCYRWTTTSKPEKSSTANSRA